MVLLQVTRAHLGKLDPVVAEQAAAETLAEQAEMDIYLEPAEQAAQAQRH